MNVYSWCVIIFLKHYADILPLFSLFVHLVVYASVIYNSKLDSHSCIFYYYYLLLDSL